MPSARNGSGRMPTTSARPPVLASGAASEETIRTRATPGLYQGLAKTLQCYDFIDGKPVERNAILGRLRERILAFAASHIAKDVAEDLTQETLLLLEEKYPQLDRVEDLLPLSLRIMRFKLVSHRRKTARRGEYTQVSVAEISLPDLESNPADQVERKEMLDRLTQAVKKLRERCRQLIRLKLQGKTFPEIQKIMGAAALNTVYTWDYRCRKNLLELMGGDWEKRK